MSSEKSYLAHIIPGIDAVMASLRMAIKKYIPRGAF